MLHGVIIAGGVGTRFWPLSRQNCPKQFLTVRGDSSLIQSAFNLVHPWIPATQMWVVTNRRFAALTREHLPQIDPFRILQEPCGRNTAPAIGLAALRLHVQDPEAVMLVMSADHLIAPAEAFRENVQLGLSLIQRDPRQLVLFGVPPSDPATGFGYIERGKSLQAGVFDVQAFHEKPDRSTADRYVREGRFFWNCGIFMWRASEILQLIQKYEPELGNALESLRPACREPDWQAELEHVFPEMKSISIDYAVLEHQPHLAVIEAKFNWDDVGSWEAIARMQPTDAQGNTVQGQHVGIQTTDCLIHSTNQHLIATIGLQDFLVVHTPDATLVARRGDEQGIRQLVSLLQQQGAERFL